MMSIDTLDISEARKQFGKLADRVREMRVLWITKHSKKAFAIVDIEWMEAMLETLEVLQDPEALRMFQESLEDIRQGRVYSHADVKKELL